MRSYVLAVTPEQAQEWLDTANKHNRRFNPKVAADYARDMKAGRWRENGEALKFDTQGNLLDGQHRAAAVVLAGIPVSMLIVTGLEPEAQATMDGGRKRTMADRLTLRSVGNAATVSAIARRVWLWDSGDLEFTATVRPTPAEINAWVDANPSVHRSAEMAIRTQTAFRPAIKSIAGTAHNILNRIDSGATAEFFAKLHTGAGLDEKDPILILRNRLTRDMVEGRNQQQMDKVRVGLYFKAWGFWRKNAQVTRLEMTRDTIMPVPE